MSHDQPSPVTVNMPPTQATDTVPIWAVRLEAKVDVALARQSGQLNNHTGDLEDHERRLRVLEATKTVSPAGLWGAVVGGVATCAALFTIFSPLIR